MSLKQQVFQYHLKELGPATVYNFRLQILPSDGDPYSSMYTTLKMLCKDTEYPGIVREDLAIPLNGSTITVPATQQVQGDLNCSFYETQDYAVRYQLTGLYLYPENYRRGYLSSPFFDIKLYTIEGPAFIKQPPVFLRGCYVKSIGPTKLDTSLVTEPMVVSAVIHYNKVEPVRDLSNVPPSQLIKHEGIAAATSVATMATGGIKNLVGNNYVDALLQPVTVAGAAGIAADML